MPSNKLPSEDIPLRKLPNDLELPTTHAAQVDEQAEIARLKAELRRVTEERDLLKKATATEIFNFIEMFYNPVKATFITVGYLPLNTKSRFFRGSKESSKIWEVHRAVKYLLSGISQFSFRG